jgi:aminopeptidase
MPDAPTDTDLRRYADLAIHVGVALREGQRLVVRAPLHAAPLARALARSAYAAGAPYVDVDWSDEEIAKIRFLEAPEGTFEELPYGQADANLGRAERGDAFLSITGEDPEALKDADPERIATFRAAASAANKPYRAYAMADRIAWSVIAAPSPGWARKVFPDAGEDAPARLWRAIFAATRADRDDPVAAWREHVAELDRRAAVLEDARFDALHFRGPGTDLRVGLADHHRWASGGSTTPEGQTFVANMPTEEVFTAPHAHRVNGTVRASVPLSQGGHLIEDFELRFEGGVAVAAHAAKGQEVLDRLLATDAGARRLGEVALVSADSPIRDGAPLFYNTLFDENAASHVALGQGYRFCVHGGPDASDDAVAGWGLNDSLIHVDFMIGSAAMDVDGVHGDPEGDPDGDDGARTPIMRAGRFVL